MVSAEERIQLRHRRGRKPVDLVLDQRHPQGRDVVWAQIRKLRRFTIPALERATRIPQATIRSYLEGLAAAGYISQGEKRQQKNARGVPVFMPCEYELLRDVGVEAPRVTRKGTPVTQGARRQRMWSAMRLLKTFTQPELVNVASRPDAPIRTEDCKDYLRYLQLAGYVKTVESHAPGRPARYCLVPATVKGPQAPMVQRIKTVYDPNVGRVVWPRAGGAS